MQIKTTEEFVNSLSKGISTVNVTVNKDILKEEIKKYVEAYIDEATFLLNNISEDTDREIVSNKIKDLKRRL